MKLEPLYRVRFTYDEPPGVAQLEGGLEHYFFVAEGRCEGGITGRMRGANHPQRPPTGRSGPTSRA